MVKPKKLYICTAEKNSKICNHKTLVKQSTTDQTAMVNHFFVKHVREEVVDHSYHLAEIKRQNGDSWLLTDIRELSSAIELNNDNLIQEKIQKYLRVLGRQTVFNPQREGVMLDTKIKRVK